MSTFRSPESAWPWLGCSAVTTTEPDPRESTVTGRTRIPTRGPFSLEELAMFGFGHRAESSWDGVMRLAFCVDGEENTHAGVEVRQYGDELELVVHGHENLQLVARQVARVLSCDHDGERSPPRVTGIPSSARCRPPPPGCAHRCSTPPTKRRSGR